jgi:ribosomal protein S8E
LVRRIEQERRDHTDRERRYREALADRERRREEVGNEAYREAFEEAYRADAEATKAQHEAEGTFMTYASGFPVTARVAAIAANARREALEEFDERHPAVPLEDF